MEQMPMTPENLITKVTQRYKRQDGTEVKIVAEAMFGIGLHRSIDVTVFRRQPSSQNWHLCNNRPHPDWRAMSVDRYVKEGRSEMLQTVTHAEILKATNLIGRPMAQFEH